MNNIGRILWNLTASLRKLFRQLENNSKKLINKEWSYKFNEICLNEELWPTYTTIRHHDPALRRNYFTTKYRQYLIKREMKQCKDTIAQLSIDIDHLKTEINNFNATPDCKAPAQNEIKLILQNHERVAKTRITKKLNKLYMGDIKIK